ncbi:MAG: carboxypeptidase regulatory-like domain-containing protein [Candidatus Sulfotelmatobacter sp.]
MRQLATSLKLAGLVFALFGLFAISAVLAYGQAIDGNVVGTVLDSQGAAVVGAQVNAVNVATNVVASTKTNSAGEYRFDNLLVGTYKITARMTGFKTITEQVDVELNKTGTRNLTLTPGAATETIEVSGTPPTIDTTTSQLQNTYESKLIQDLPTVSTGSGVINLSLLDAGVATTGGIGVGSGPSVSGQRPRNNNFTVEGVDNNNKSVTGPLLQLPNDSVDQFTVLQNQFSPEFGHSSGGQFNQTIKSGSNSFHGRLYEYFQNRNLNAQDSQVALSQVSQGIKPFNTRYDNNRFGGQVGGPILKNKLFFFTDWEYNPIGNATSSSGCAPTAAGYAVIAATPGTSSTNLTQFQTAVGAARVQAPPPSGDALCPAWAVGYGDGAGGAGSVAIGDVGFSGANYQNYLTTVNSVDWDISAKDQVRGRYAYEKNNAIDFNGQIPSFWTITPSRYGLFTLSEYHNFTANLNNEVRVGFNRYANTLPSGNFSFPGLNAYPNLVVGIGESSGVQLGPDGNAPQFGYQNFYQLVDNISWIRGRHNFKFGAEYREYIAPQGFTQRVRGDYEYLFFNTYFSDLAPDYFGERSVGNSTYYGNQNMFYGFGNDDWHMFKNFTLNLGLRYEFTQVPLAEREWQPLNAVANAPGVITFGAPTAQKTNFLPHVGFAYSPGSSGRTSIRGGFSMAQDVLYDNLGLLTAPPEVQQTCDVGSPTATCFWKNTGFLAAGGLPFQATIPPITDPTLARSVTGGYVPNQKLPYSETYTLGVQHIFASKYTAEVRYVGTRGIHLPVQDRINRQPKTSATDNLPYYFTAPSQGTLDALTNNYAAIDANSNYVPAYLNAGFLSNITSYQPYGASKYNGLQTSLKRSFANGLQFQAAWTWSHLMDNSTADVFSTYLTPRRPQDNTCFACDWSDSALDRRHRITLEALYDIPFFKSAGRFMKNVVGNWEAGPIYTFQSPEYATVQSGVDVNGNGDSAGDRTFINPAGVKGTGGGYIPLCNSSLSTVDPGGTCGDDGSLSALVAYQAASPTAYYNQAGQYSFPNARRNTLAMPRISNVDLTALKRINITERQSVEFQFQALNVLNHAQYVPGYISDVAPLGYTGSNILSMLEPQDPTFNQPKSVFSQHPRQVVLVLKYNF